MRSFWRGRLTGAFRKKPTLEIHIPISPTEYFFTMVHYFAASLRRYGGSLANSRIVVTVGADQAEENLPARLPWSRRYAIEWRWLDRDIYRRHTYFATAVERFRHDFHSDVVMMVDADVLVTATFADLVEQVHQTGRFAGLIAYISPFTELGDTCSNETWWHRIFAEAGLGVPNLSCEHTGWGTLVTDECRRHCPPYFNLGVLLAPGNVMRRIGEIIYSEMAAVDRTIEIFYKCQLALALAIARLKIAILPLSLRFNFPNEPSMESPFRRDLEDVRLLHYLRLNSVNKWRDFQSPQSVAAILNRTDLSGANEILRQRLLAIHSEVASNTRAA